MLGKIRRGTKVLSILYRMKRIEGDLKRLGLSWIPDAQGRLASMLVCELWSPGCSDPAGREAKPLPAPIPVQELVLPAGISARKGLN